MRALAILLLYLSTIIEVKTRDSFEDFDGIAINSKVAATGRFLKQAKEEQDQPQYNYYYNSLNTIGCNPTITNCSVKGSVSSCTDVFLPGMGDCSVVLTLGLCEDPNVKGIYCDQTCGLCGSSSPFLDCDDVALPGMTDCSEVVSSNICDQDQIKGTFCRASCGECGTPTPTPAPVPSPTPTPTLVPVFPPPESVATSPATLNGPTTLAVAQKERTCKSVAYDFVAAECRDQLQYTINRGVVAAPPDYMVSLQSPVNKGDKRVYGECFKHFCGGSLIAPNLVLTAAHCITPKYFGNFGEDGFISKELYVAQAPDCRHDQGYQRAGIYRVLIFPGYNSDTFVGDVAVLVLYNNMLGPYIQYQQPLGLSLKNNDNLVVMGYGRQSQSESQYANIPFITLNMSYMEDDTCSQWIEFEDYTDLSSVYSEKEIVCAKVSGGVSGSTCEGDSGGPLVKKGATEADDILVGIDSYRSNLPCGTGSLTLFTEVWNDQISAWIHDMVQIHGFATAGVEWLRPGELNGPGPSTRGTSGP